LAGLAHSYTSTSLDYLSLNARATGKLAEAAAQQGVKHFIYLSTAKVYGEGWPDGEPHPAYVETDTPEPADDYALSKLRAEQHLKDITGQSAMRCTILRPPLVYGPGVRANFLQMLGAVRKGVPLPLASIRNRRSLVYVNNLCALIQNLIEKQPASDRIYGIADVSISTPDLIRAVAAALDVPSRLFPCPVGLLRLAGRLIGRTGAIERLTRSFVVDASRIEKELGWRPPIPLPEAMRATAEWYTGQVSSEA
jgi:nucleoside-diphosphate-sugar epimerase